MVSALRTYVTYPNLITLGRLVLVPVFGALVRQERWAFSFWLCCFLVLTDALDGFLARSLQQRTDVGAYLDPFADKLLVLTGFSLLSLKGYIPLWLLTLVLTRDGLIVAAVIFYFLIKGLPMEAKPTFLGKSAALGQFLFILFCLGILKAGFDTHTLTPLGWGVAGLTLASLVQYGWIFISSFENPREPHSIS